MHSKFSKLSGASAFVLMRNPGAPRVIHRTLVIATFAGAVSASHAAASQEDIELPPPAPDTTPAARRPARFTLFVDNDGVLKPNDRSDRYYTSGVKVDMSFQPQWAEPFAGFVPLGADFDPARTAFGVSAAQLIFTPWKNNRPVPREDDHPYGGYLYGSLYLQRAEAPADDDPIRRSTFDHVQLDFGVVGPSSLAEESQKEVHRITGTRLPKGWSHQLKDEAAVNMTFRRKVRLEFEFPDSEITLQLIPEAGFDVGTVWRQAVGGVTVRFGQNLPDDYGASRLLLPGAAVAAPKDGFGWEVYFRGEGRVVQHDIFLDGNTWQDSASVDKYPLVGELSAGFVLRFGANVELGYSQTYQTEQFEGQDGWHGWGSIFVRALWNF